MRIGWLHNLLYSTVILFIAADVGLMIRLRSAISKQAVYSAVSRDSNLQPTTPPDGFDASGKRVTLSLPRSGWVVRYAARYCTYCVQDEPLWNAMSKELTSQGFESIIVVSTASEQYPSTPNQLTFVNMDWIKHFRLTVTPTILVFAKDGQLIWAHQGTLNRSDLASIVSAIYTRRSH